jgi:hypothetical protein
LKTRPIAGADWTVDTAVIYHQLSHPKTLPVLVRKFKRQLRRDAKQAGLVPRKIRSTDPNDDPIQLTLLG